MDLDIVDHLAIQVTDIATSTTWYQQQFNTEVLYQDKTWALLQFQNIKLALVVENQHPPHFAIKSETPEKYGELTPHRDGSASVYIHDTDENAIEMIRYG